jgi:hypothetical protein
MMTRLASLVSISLAPLAGAIEQSDFPFAHADLLSEGTGKPDNVG